MVLELENLDAENLDFENLDVDLGGVTVLHQLSAAFAFGQVVGVIGPNGAGKTTLLRTAAGICKPSAGRINLRGRDIATWPRRELARQIAYLGQENDIKWPLRVRRVVELGRLPHLQPWQRPGPEDHLAVDHAMAMANIQGLADRSSFALSGGERMRVLIARALAVAPRVILADEPVAALDPRHQLSIMELFRDHARKGGLVLTALHDLMLAARFCDSLIILNNGRLAGFGPTQEILQADLLQSIYDVEMREFMLAGVRVLLPWQAKNPEADAP